MSIATELQRILATKKDLRNALNIDDSVPFSQYAAHIPWHGETPPASTRFFDFVGNRYSADGFPALLSSLGITFTRLSSATQWKDGVLVGVAANVMRLDKTKGLLIEPQRTNISRPSEGASAVGFGAIPPVVTNVIQDFGGRDVVVPRSIFAAGTTSGYAGRSDLGSLAYTEVGKYYRGSIYAKGVSNGLYIYHAGNGGRGVISTGFSTTDKFQRVYSDTLLEGWAGPQRLVAMKNSPESTGDVSITGAQLEDVGSLGGLASSYIKTTSAPVTRSPDILNIPLLPSQTITGDWDAGVTYSLAGDIATFTGHGYIRNIVVEEL